jgi:CheY-like chemotaxis protein
MIAPNTMQNLSLSSKYSGPGAVPPFVLLFSGDPDTRLIFKILLSILKYPVIEAQSVGECERLMAKARPGMVLMDVRFPFYIEDQTFLSQMVEEGKFEGLPVVLLSNYSRENFPDLDKLFDVRDHLTKPVSFLQLEICLKNNFDYDLRQIDEKRCA